jgi:uroporphyrinogen decarboxylase
MTPRERVLAAFAHQEPDRVPVWFGASPQFILKARTELRLGSTEELLQRLGDDFRRVVAPYSGPESRSPDRGLAPGVSCRTVFGVEHRGVGCGMPVNPPLAEATLGTLDDYPWPDADWIDVSGLRAEALRWDGKYAILGGDWSPFWHDANELLGMQNFLCKMHSEPELVDAVLEHVARYYLEVNRRIFDAAGDRVDIFFIGNDFGSQRGPLISPAMFRRFILPPLKRLVSLGHDYGLKVMMHCCGSFAPLIPAMIEAGLDGLQGLQPITPDMQPQSLKAAFGSRLLFNGCIDSHHVLIEGTPEVVQKKTRETLKVMKRGGGYVVSASHDYILEETPVENVVAMFDAARECGGS